MQPLVVLLRPWRRAIILGAFMLATQFPQRSSAFVSSVHPHHHSPTTTPTRMARTGDALFALHGRCTSAIPDRMSRSNSDNNDNGVMSMGGHHLPQRYPPPRWTRENRVKLMGRRRTEGEDSPGRVRKAAAQWDQGRGNNRFAYSAAATAAAGQEADGSTFRLFNTAGRAKRAFVPMDNKRVKFYSCGPTVYDHAHIGNFRAFLTYDVLKRWLLYQGYEVDHVCNLTDVDDKIIKRMARDGVSLQDLTGKYTRLFLDDLEALNILPASRYPRATEHMDDIVDMIQGLVDKGLAYERNGSVYFRVSEFPTYGALACLDRSGMQDGAGEGGGITDAEEFRSEKESSKDFVLWKAYKEEDMDIFWDTSLGKGRPGWHIECSAMARRYLGDTLDIHAGGVDLVFPHHENEIAQSEGFTGKPFCGCWVHNAFVNVDGEKMSKSKGNFLTLKNTLKTGLDARAFRYLVVSSQYRTTLAFSSTSLDSARKTVQRLDKLRVALEAVVAAAADKAPESKGTDNTGDSDDVSEVLQEAVCKSLSDFRAGMNDDLNTPRAAAALFGLVKAGETALKQKHSEDGAGISPGEAGLLLSALDRIDAVFGISYQPAGYEELPGAVDSAEESGTGDGSKWPEGLAELLEKRLVARESKDWATADAVRDEIQGLGYAVKDVKGGQPIVTRL